MDDFQVFFDQCVHARAIYLHFRIFAEESTAQDRARFEKSAPVFVGDMLRCFRLSIYLETCKLLDQPKDGRGNENLSIFYMIDKIDLSSFIEASALNEKKEHFYSFRKKLEPARHKLIAHIDKKAHLDGIALGQASVEDWNLFWTDLDDIINGLSRSLKRGPERLADIGGMTDAEGLLVALRKAEALDCLVNAGNAQAIDALFKTE